MSNSARITRILSAVLSAILCLILSAPVLAQFPAGGGGTGVGGGVGGAGVGGGGVGGAGVGGAGGAAGGGGANVGGIRINALGVVTPVPNLKKSATLTKKRMQAVAQKFVAGDVQQPCPQRHVSLVGLESAYRQAQEVGGLIPVDIFYLAGLQRIDYLLVYPEEGDLVIAGPAEGFAPGPNGRVIGLESGRPPLRLDDLVAALHAAQHGEPVGCSIDAVPKDLAALERYVSQNSNPSAPAIARQRYHKMAEILGMQDVRVFGVPKDSHFAQTLVEADYRMKRVSMGLEPARVRGFRTHLSMLTATGNSVQRWWFTPLYEAIYTNDDRSAFELAGQRMQLLSQEEVVSADGRRSDANFTRLSTRKYAKHFTEKFPKLVERIPVFAQLQNLVDLTILAALLRNEGLPEQVDWPMTIFMQESHPQFPKGHTPRTVASVANARRASRGMVLGLVGGGVVIHPQRTIGQIDIRVDAKRGLEDARSRPTATGDRDHRATWWWD